MSKLPVHRLLALVAIAIAVSPAGAAAQSTGEPPPDVRMQFGPLYVNPTIALTNVGVDDNVFNDPDTASPKSDYTMTMTPASDMWLRFGSSWLSADLREDLVYYNQYTNQRSANTTLRGTWTIPLNRLTITPGGEWVRTRERPGFEIDARARRTDLAYNGSVEFRAMSKTFIGVRGERRVVRFDEGQLFLGVDLQTELSRTSTSAAITVRNQLTPLTALVFDVGRVEDRFDDSALRDSDSTVASAGVKFDKFALIKGDATFGYRDFRPRTSGVPGYRGGTFHVDLSYVALGTTKLGVQSMRDVQYSYDVDQPYYVQTGITGSIQQQIYGPVDVTADVGTQRLAYQDRAGAAVPFANRVDRIQAFGGGAGYRLGRDVRIGVTIERQRRDSQVDARRYHDLRYGVSVSYGV